MFTQVRTLPIIGLAWFVATLVFFITQTGLSAVPPIAVDALSSLFLTYFPVLALCVFLLPYLTRGRDAFDWETLYALNREKAGVEVLAAFIYLLVTQLVLGLFFDIGLHFPGPHVYESESFAYQHVVVWTLVNTVVYALVPMLWLRGQGLNLVEFMQALQWRRNIWILIAFWALDFFWTHYWGCPFFLPHCRAIPRRYPDQYSGQHLWCRTTSGHFDARRCHPPVNADLREQTCGHLNRRIVLCDLQFVRSGRGLQYLKYGDS